MYPIKLNIAPFFPCWLAFLWAGQNTVHRLPNWFPGTGYRKIANQWAHEYEEFIDIPFKYVKDQMVRKATFSLGLKLSRAVNTISAV